MKSTNQSKLPDIFSWFAMVLFTIAAFFITYYYSFSGPIQAMIWLSWLILIFICDYFTNKGQQAFTFAQEAKIELLKVVWPTRQETIQTTTIVMAMVTFTGFILWGVDSVMVWVIARITHLG